LIRRILWALLALAPVTILIDTLTHADKVLLFVLSCAALIPLAWLIGEATDHASEHTGPGIGGFLNASFGNAPELIIALLAIAGGLPDVVRGSITGSIVSNILLVLGVALWAKGDGELDRASLLGQLALVVVAVLAFLVVAVPGFDGDPNRHSLAVLGVPVAVALLLIYVGATVRSLRRHRRIDSGSGEESAWRLPVALAVLAIATVATAVISEILVHSLHSFADAAGFSEFFVAAVIVAIVGNAAEHGGAVVIARRGNVRLASEIAISSSAQVALLVTPVVALASFLVRPPLALSFRPIELAAMGSAAVFVAFVIRDGKSRRWEGVLLVAVFVAVAGAFWVAGDR
jgi:Ca2+:H+ antiporter